MSEQTTLAQIGQALGSETMAYCIALYEAEQLRLVEAVPAAQSDLSYGPHERHRFDLYRPAERTGPAPMLVFLHGGGFVRGDKGGAQDWRNANVGRWAASEGLVGVVANYRLAPDHQYPAGAQDSVRLIDHLRTQAAALGADPDRIYLMGSSAGAVHAAGYLDHVGRSADPGIAGLVLLSGLYGYTPLDDGDLAYFGSQESYAQKTPRRVLVETQVPLLVACSQYDPARFQAEFLGLLDERLGRHGTVPRSHIGLGHNHYSLAMHLGTADRRLARTILDFIASSDDAGNSGADHD